MENELPCRACWIQAFCPSLERWGSQLAAIGKSPIDRRVFEKSLWNVLCRTGGRVILSTAARFFTTVRVCTVWIQYVREGMDGLGDTRRYMPLGIQATNVLRVLAPRQGRTSFRKKGSPGDRPKQKCIPPPHAEEDPDGRMESLTNINVL